MAKRGGKKHKSSRPTRLSLLDLPPEVRLATVCLISARSVALLRLVCKELRALVDAQEDRIERHISVIQHQRLERFLANLAVFQYPENIPVQNFLDGLKFWIKHRAGLSVRHGPSRQAATLWLVHLLLIKLASLSGLPGTMSDNESQSLLDWAFVAHETTFFYLQYHTVGFLKNGEAELLGRSPDVWHTFVEEELGHQIPNIDLAQIFTAIASGDPHFFESKIYEIRQGLFEDTPYGVLSTYAKRYDIRNNPGAGCQLTSTMVEAPFTSDALIELLGLPKLPDSAIFACRAKQDQRVRLKAYDLLLELAKTGEVKGLKKAAILECIEIY